MLVLPQSVAAIITLNGVPNPNTNNTIPNVLNIVFAMSASIALLMVVINGLRYIIARGDAGATSSAKNGILYAIVGLIVVMAAYSIVAFTVKGVG
jgi:hypothetical protein